MGEKIIRSTLNEAYSANKAGNKNVTYGYDYRDGMEQATDAPIGTEDDFTAYVDTNYDNEALAQVKHVGETVTTTYEEIDSDVSSVTRTDKDGNEVYYRQFGKRSNNPNQNLLSTYRKERELTKKIAAVAAERIMGAIERGTERDISESINQLREALPSIAEQVIDGDKNPNLKSNPDNYLEHAPKWHQHGIVTHSLEFAKAMETTIPSYIKKWGLEEPVDEVLSEQIEGVEKRQLLEVASLLHDVGKFTAREEEHDHDEVSYSFTDHEEHSGEIIRTQLHDTLQGLKLTDKQIEYVARCAELHFELGKVRRASKENGGFTIAFVDTPAFQGAAQEIINNNLDFALEIGLMFIADGLSKSEVKADGLDDEEIASERPKLESELANKGLNPKLINQALQMPVNFKVARTYLNQWAENR